MKWNAVLRSTAFLLCLIVWSPAVLQAQSPTQNVVARTLFLEGQNLWDEGKFSEAEKKFREALTKYPKADQSDRTAYYLITTLVRLGRVPEARTEIENFNKSYPQSTWKSDVDEQRVALTHVRFNGGVSGIGSSFTGINPYEPAVNFTKTPGVNQRVVVRRNAGVNPTDASLPKAVTAPFSVTVVAENTSLQSEILRVIVEKAPDRGIEIAKERLKTHPSDPAVISNLGTIAHSNSAQALPFLIRLAGSPANPNAHRQAIFWIGRHNGDKEDVAKVLWDIMATSSEREVDVGVAEAFATFNPNERRVAFDKFVEGKGPQRLTVLEKVYRSSTSGPVRTQIAEAAAQIPDIKTVTFLADVARNDKDATVRRSAVLALATRKEVDTVKALEELLKTLPLTEQKK